MDIKQQLKRLLDITEEIRARAADLDQMQAGAQGHLDKAEYDLQQVVADLRDILPGISDRASIPSAPSASAATQEPPSAKRRRA
jgi:hypothetical protein